MTGFASAWSARAGGFIRAALRAGMTGCALLLLLPATVHAAGQTLRVHAANTASETGILQALADDFQKRHPDIRVILTSAGSLQVLEAARAGQADLTITHQPQGEALLLSEGFGLRRASFMYNGFAIMGPRQDPLKLSGERDLIKVMRLLAAKQADFVVPGSRSGTASRLNELWTLAGIKPDWVGYEVMDVRASATLAQAAMSGVYSFVDLGTYYKNREFLPRDYIPLFRDHILLRNTYTATVINSARVAGVNTAAADVFLEYLVSDTGQAMVRDFSEARFGVSLFSPAAHLDESLRVERARRELEAEQRTVAILVTLIGVLLLAGVGAALLAWRVQRLERARRHALSEKLAADMASKAKSEFLANMSHEIRTPLTAIIGFAETLPDTQVSAAERLAAVQSIARNGRHLLQLINNILDMAKIEGDKLEVEHIAVAPVTLVEEVRALMEPLARTRELAFRVEYVFPLPATIDSDPVRLRQILINLCNNAIKFTGHGEVRLRVSCDRDAEDMCFEVRDTGIGLTPEQQARLFGSFTQADASINRRYGGSGLGLHLSRRLAELLGGDIAVSSEPGHGSCFTLTVATGALANAVFISAPPVQASHETATMPVLGGRVLLAEDNPDNQRLVAMHVARTGAELAIASNGQEAVTRAKVEAFDLILMDMQMPVMDGLAATRTLRASGYSTPIVALTANAFRENRDECLAAGCTDFLTKPIDRAALLAVLATHLKPAAAPAPNREPVTSALLEEEDGMADLVSRFVERLPQILESLAAALGESNWAELKRIAHDLKGTGGGYGYPQLSTLAARLEFEILKQDAAAAGERIGELRELVARIECGLQLPAADTPVVRIAPAA
jgi:signal transduction histidine kinase/DNA-binding NarL/FixJ family response regulator